MGATVTTVCPSMSMDQKHTDTVLMPKSDVDFKDSEYREWFVDSLLNIPLLNADDVHQEIFTLDTHLSTSLSKEAEYHENTSEFDISLDLWLLGLTDEGCVESEGLTIRHELMLSPQAIRAPLRSVRADKRAFPST
jgi:hypothetical protein